MKCIKVENEVYRTDDISAFALVQNRKAEYSSKQNWKEEGRKVLPPSQAIQILNNKNNQMKEKR